MSTLNDSQISSAALLRYVDEISRVHQLIPFGKDIMEKIITQFLRLPSPFDYRLLTRTEKHLVAKCQEAYLFVMQWKSKSDLDWIKHHEDVRKRLLSLLVSDSQPYHMQGIELDRWCRGVFQHIKRVVPRFRKKPNGTRDYPEERQALVDAMYELVQLARDSDDRTSIMLYSQYLMTLCQRSSLSPSSFVIKCPEMSDRDPVETGASALVYHGHFGGQEVAMKTFRLYYNTVARVKKRFLKEAFFVKILRHPNVIPFIGVVDEPNRLCIVSPWMKNGDVMNFLKKSPNACKKELVEQVADGLHFLSEYNIVHGDLKGANVLITDDEKACISDFGISSIQEHVDPMPLTVLDPALERALLLRCREALREGGMSQSLVPTLSSRMSSFSGAGTYRWMAPERLIPESMGLSSAKPTFASDVFAWAMLTLEIYSGDVPFRHDTQNIACLNIIAGRRPPRPPDTPGAVWLLVQDCWKPEPARRPQIWNVYNRLACIP